MNPILLAIIIILIASYLLSSLLDYLNGKRWEEHVPPDLQEFYDEEKYQKARVYFITNKRFSFYSESFSLLLMLFMLLSGGFAYLDDYVHELTVQPVYTTLLFFGILFIASDLLSIPFSVYHTFVIEEKFGFNRTNINTFVLDKLKQYVIGAIVGGALLGLFTWFYIKAGSLFWIYTWVLFALVLLFTTMFYASLLLPLFNKLTPLAEGELRTAIEEYCRKAGFKLDNLFVMDGSKRSAKANAFFSGLGAKKRIVLYDTLIEKHTKEELVAILAHEIGHYKKKHTRSGLILGLLQTGLMLYLMSWIISNPALSHALGAEHHSFHLGLLVFGLLYSPVSMVLGIGMNVLSRKNEFEADRFAAETYGAAPLQSALKKLSVDHLSNLKPHPLDVFLNYSHPPLLVRLDALDKFRRN